jgi:zinc finger FYVE domain-containing protein 26
VDIYAGVVTNLGLKKRSKDITEFFKNIKGIIDDDDWDQVILAFATYELSVCDAKYI